MRITTSSLLLLVGWLVVLCPARSNAASRARRSGAASPAPAVALPASPTLGDLPELPNFEAIAELRERAKNPGAAAAARRTEEIAQLRGQLARKPTDPAVVRWLHRLAELEHAEAHWQQRVANVAQVRARAALAKELQKLARKRKRYELKRALAIRRHWGLPATPNLTPTTLIPPDVPIDLRRTIQDYETIIANHPRYRRMDDVLVQAGMLRIQHGQQRKSLPSIATGEQYLNQVLHEFGWSPLAARARVQLADLALARRDADKARDYLTDLANHEKVPAVRDYARLQLARMLARRDVAKAIAALTLLASKTPDATLRGLAEREVKRLRPLLPPAAQ